MREVDLATAVSLSPQFLLRAYTQQYTKKCGIECYEQILKMRGSLKGFEHENKNKTPQERNRYYNGKRLGKMSGKARRNMVGN
jgi:hypothetical protein